ncbi:MAG: RNA-binding cell elongation regulator Jag/EloR [bacterium]
MGTTIIYNVTESRRKEIMKSVKMKGRSVEEAKKAAIEVLGVGEEQIEVKVINEGKPAVMGILGGEESEVEVFVKSGEAEEAREVLQNILDKMGLLAAAEGKLNGETIILDVKGEDMGRIIGKEGAMLKALEIIVSSIVSKIMGRRTRVSIDAGGYKEKREQVLSKLAKEVAEEVESTKTEKVLPYMEPADRRMIHLALAENPNIKTESRGEGKDRRIVISPK